MEDNMLNNGTVLKSEWIVTDDDVISDDFVEVFCSECNTRFAVPKDEYKNLMSVSDGENNNFICDACLLNDLKDDSYDESYSEELDSEDATDIIDEALGN